MPLYEFECKCGNRFDQVCTLGAESCRCDCGKIGKRVFSVPAVILKGGGWTTNDNVMNDQMKVVNKEIKGMGENI